MNSALVLEDIPAARTWLVQAVGEAFPGCAVAEADGIAAARANIAERVPELALIDLGLPDGDGMDILRPLAERDCVCVVTTVFADDAHLFPALQAGARGYVLKDQSCGEIVELLAGICAGRPPLSPSIAQRLLTHFAAEPASDAPRLSPREREILEMISNGHSVPRVAEALGITANTAAGYVKQVYRKLNVSSRAEAALEASRLGLLR